MALCKTGSLILKSVKPILANPCFVIPSSINFQVRNAARKGYREKALRKKQSAAEASPTVSKEVNTIRRKYAKIKKTVDLNKPEPPSDDVIVLDNFNYKKFSLPEAVSMHTEYHHPTVYNNPSAPITLRIEICMFGKTERQFIKPFSGVANIPHPFVISHQKEILVLCQPEHTELAYSSGASVAGGIDVIKKIQEGIIQPSLYDYIVAHSGFLPELTPVRNLLKNQFPKASKGTLTADLKTAIHRFRHGIEYKCIQLGAADSFGFIECSIGKIDMELIQLEENLKALIADVEKNKLVKDRDFITWIWCLSPPSDEQFSIDLTKYLEKKEQDIDDDDDDDDGRKTVNSKK